MFLLGVPYPTIRTRLKVVTRADLKIGGTPSQESFECALRSDAIGAPALLSFLREDALFDEREEFALHCLLAYVL